MVSERRRLRLTGHSDNHHRQILELVTGRGLFSRRFSPRPRNVGRN